MTKLPRWRKSSHSNETATCVELAGDLDALRDSKNPDGPVLRVAGLTRFLNEIKAGTFDRAR